MVPPEAIAVALAIALSYYAAIGTVRGAKWAGHKVKRGVIALVHVVHHKQEPPDATP